MIKLRLQVSCPSVRQSCKVTVNETRYATDPRMRHEDGVVRPGSPAGSHCRCRPRAPSLSGSSTTSLWQLHPPQRLSLESKTHQLSENPPRLVGCPHDICRCRAR